MKRGGVFLDIAEIVVITHSKETKKKHLVEDSYLGQVGLCISYENDFLSRPEVKYTICPIINELTLNKINSKFKRPVSALVIYNELFIRLELCDTFIYCDKSIMLSYLFFLFWISFFSTFTCTIIPNFSLLSCKWINIDWLSVCQVIFCMHIPCKLYLYFWIVKSYFGLCTQHKH